MTCPTSKKRKVVCGCNLGGILDRWENVSKVRPAGDTGGTHYTSAPYTRHDPTDLSSGCYVGSCPDATPGVCAGWLIGGDLNGLSAQAIDDLVDDIMACAGADATHETKDHNCYFKNGDSIDLRIKKLFGFQSIFAKKFWHGAFGFVDSDGYSPNPEDAPSQVKYLTMARTSEYHQSQSYITLNTYGYTDALPAGEYKVSYTDSVGNVTRAVARLKGTIQQSGAVLTTTSGNTGIVLVNPSGTSDFYATHGSDPVETAIACPDTDHLQLYPDMVTWPAGLTNLPAMAVFIAALTDAATAGFTLPTFTVDGFEFAASWVSGSVTNTLGISIARANDSYVWDCSYIRIQDYTADSKIKLSDTYSGSITLSDPYTSAMCKEDFIALLNAWDMSDVTLHGLMYDDARRVAAELLRIGGLRTDENLSLAALCVYDEVGPQSPAGFNCPMNDYSLPLVNDAAGNAPGDPGYITTWAQRDWLDPNDYVWESPAGGFSTFPNPAGGNILKTPMRTGAIIAHTGAGRDRHFWYGFHKFKRVPQLDSSAGCAATGMYLWFPDTIGEESNAALPKATMRWLGQEEAQYDGLLASADPPDGVYPQAWMTQKGGVLKGGKYIQATQKWPAVNYGRPCGWDKYAKDETTVCCITSGAAPSFTIKKTGNAIAPLAAGGLAVNDYVIIEGDGCYKITGITDDGTADWDSTGDPYQQFTVTLGAKIDDLPTGYAFFDPEQSSDGATHIGKMRWPSSSGICGRAAITTAEAAGTVTIAATIALPTLRLDPVTGTILVDLYKVGMTDKIQATLTRVDDTHFTFTHAAIPDYVWMTGRDVDYTKTSTSKRTGVHADWQFDQRAAFHITPPTWYGGVSGCTSAAISQFNYDAGNCSVVGIVPHTEGETVEQFQNKILFGFPDDFAFDDVYGAHWQAAVFLTMPDPFWQAPFKPDCDIISPDTLKMKEDDGSGQGPSIEDITESGTNWTYFYAHHPLVEAAKDIPAGSVLPAGVSLFYNADIEPLFYPHGIPIGGLGGEYASIETDWGFTARACGNIESSGLFGSKYAPFVTCP